MKKSYYQILGLAKDAPPDDIRTHYQERRQQFSTHPEIVRMLDEAAAVLTDPERRRDYDRGLQATLAQTALPVRPDGSTRSGERRLRGVHFFFLGLLVAVAYGWHSVGQTRLRPANPPPTPVAAATANASPPASPEEPPVLSLTPVPPVPPRPTATTAAPANESPPRLTRPDKKPGFDPSYMAWAVYQIVGAKGRGSGVMLERDKIVTNCHVIAGSYRPNSITAINSATREAFYPEKIAILSDSEDVCLLHVPGAPDYLANWGSTSGIKIGAPTHTVSFPGREGLTWSSGNLLSRENVRGLDVLLTSNDCRPGVSGGPLFDNEGNVVGITSAGRNYRLRSGEVIQGECVSIEAETARQVMWRTLMSLAIAPIRYDGVWNSAQ